MDDVGFMDSDDSIDYLRENLEVSLPVKIVSPIL